MSQTITDHLKEALNQLVDDDEQTVEENFIHQLDDETVQINEKTYRIAINYREGFDVVAFRGRYEEFFTKFDFIVGDWAHDQLRLKGFYQLQTKGVPRDQTIDFLEDYIKEHCSYEAKYFVLGTNQALEEFQKIENEGRLMSIGGNIHAQKQSSRPNHRRRRRNSSRNRRRNHKNQFVIKKRPDQ